MKPVTCNLKPETGTMNCKPEKIGENVTIYTGDCLKILPTLEPVKMIFADPPDNLGVKYDGFVDQWDNVFAYLAWLWRVIEAAIEKCDILWCSYHAKWDCALKAVGSGKYIPGVDYRTFIWRFTFGQHNNYDCGYGHRPILRMRDPGAKIYPKAIRVPSLRQTKYNDSRAKEGGRVPDDVWEFPRVCGTFKEKRTWHPNQHPEALMERMIKLSCGPGESVIDLFGGSGTTARVCKRLGVPCTLIEISPTYCAKMKEELRQDGNRTMNNEKCKMKPETCNL